MQVRDLTYLFLSAYLLSAIIKVVVYRRDTRIRQCIVLSMMISLIFAIIQRLMPLNLGQDWNADAEQHAR